MAFLDETGLAELWSLIDEKHSQIAVGSYVGTGKNGSSNPNSLSFGFEPKMLIIADGIFGFNSSQYGTPNPIFVKGKSEYSLLTTVKNVMTAQATAGKVTINVTFSGNSVSWYATFPNGGALSDTASYEYQFNMTGKTYNYIAIG